MIRPRAMPQTVRKLSVGSAKHTLISGLGFLAVNSVQHDRLLVARKPLVFLAVPTGLDRQLPPDSVEKVVLEVMLVI